MYVEVDISGHVRGNNHVVIGMGGGFTRSILITSSEKRKATQIIRYKKPRWGEKRIHIRLYSLLLFCLIRDHIPQISQLVIDVDYPGYENDIKSDILDLCHKHAIPVDKHKFSFKQIGKKSLAHDVAYLTYTGKRPPDLIISAKDIAGILHN